MTNPENISDADLEGVAGGVKGSMSDAEKKKMKMKQDAQRTDTKPFSGTKDTKADLDISGK
ncbi:hypothetical protein N9P88_02610 [Planctomycetota bacterium]|nr:hypothetical protein [Planctomycetota bacterium]MDC3251643.1 hypothetical protein [Planctomycetota bacterium]MDG2085338.1 hypothetical protein [Planctomycetota bacterium]